MIFLGQGWQFSMVYHIPYIPPVYQWIPVLHSIAIILYRDLSWNPGGPNVFCDLVSQVGSATNESSAKIALCICSKWVVWEQTQSPLAIIHLSSSQALHPRHDPPAEPISLDCFHPNSLWPASDLQLCHQHLSIQVLFPLFNISIMLKSALPSTMWIKVSGTIFFKSFQLFDGSISPPSIFNLVLESSIL